MPVKINPSVTFLEFLLIVDSKNFSFRNLNLLGFLVETERSFILDSPCINLFFIDLQGDFCNFVKKIKTQKDTFALSSISDTYTNYIHC